MQQKSDIHIFQGMQGDLDPHKHKPEYLIDAKNIRITARGENTEFAITSEKPSSLVEQNSNPIIIDGTYLGHCVLNNYVVVFTTSNDEYPDKIIRLEQIQPNKFEKKILYEGHLNFSVEHPIEALSSYETEAIQKVYWTDGYNQPRMINILSDKQYIDTSFDFCQTLELEEEFHVEKIIGANGSFPAGAIQYCITYYNKYGQETNIVWQSPIYYTSFIDRAGSPEETISNAFKIFIQNADTNFDYIRLYSIMRTSLDAQPTVRVVSDIEVKEASKYSIKNILKRGSDITIVDHSCFYIDSGERKYTYSDLGEVTIDINSNDKIGFGEWPYVQVSKFHKYDVTNDTTTLIIRHNLTERVEQLSNGDTVYITTTPLYNGNPRREIPIQYGIVVRNENKKIATNVFSESTMTNNVIKAVEIRVGADNSSFEAATDISEIPYISKTTTDLPIYNSKFPATYSDTYYKFKEINGNIYYTDVEGNPIKILNDGTWDTLYISSKPEVDIVRNGESNWLYNKEYKVIIALKDNNWVTPNIESASSEDIKITPIDLGESTIKVKKNGVIYDLNDRNIGIPISNFWSDSVNAKIDHITIKGYIGYVQDGQGYQEIDITGTNEIQTRFAILNKKGDSFTTGNNIYTLSEFFDNNDALVLIPKIPIRLYDDSGPLPGSHFQCTILVVQANPNQDNSYILTSSSSDAIFEKSANYYDDTYHNLEVEEAAKPDRISDLDYDNLLVSYSSFNKNEEIYSIVDDGLKGYTIDPSELLYKGGEDIVAQAMCQKDGTLFLGNLKITRPSLSKEITDVYRKKEELLTESTRKFTLEKEEDNFYPRGITLNSKSVSDEETEPSYNINTTTFKKGEKYRFGFQCQYKTGKWSEPIFIADHIINTSPSNTELPVVKASLDLKQIAKAGYKKVRGVVVLPTIQDRRIITQGLLCPTVYNCKDRYNHTPDIQSSWFIRPFGGNAEYHHNYVVGGTDVITNSEIQGTFPSLQGKPVGEGFIEVPVIPKPINPNILDVSWKEVNSLFAVDQHYVTLHSADIQFDPDLPTLDLTGVRLNVVGFAHITGHASDIDIQTSSSTITSKSTGFVRHSEQINNGDTLMSGYFYKDWLVNDAKDGDKTEYIYWDDEKYEASFLVYPWHRSGSLNNDVIRPADAGTRSAKLKKKVISNIKIFNTPTYLSSVTAYGESKVALFNFDQMQMVKVNSMIYYGNIDTMLSTATKYSTIFQLSEKEGDEDQLVKNPITFNWLDKDVLVYLEESSHDDDSGYRSNYNITEKNIIDLKEGAGNLVEDFKRSKESIRMKYKSAPHVIIDLGEGNTLNSEESGLYIGELVRDTYPDFGGDSDFALKANLWIPAGEAVKINSTGNTNITWEWGDTYYQRFDFLKTYAFTNEDENSIVEIGSFVGEFRVNADGRYDRNKGQVSNLNMSPQNFNLWNPVYTQKNNFFNYRMLDEDYYTNSEYPTQVTWSLEKKSSDIVDNWTSITLASTMDLDGDKGFITALETYNSNIYAFQDKGLSNILFNSRVQLNTTDGVPIEISNNYKVEGTRYISDSIGCSNKWSVCRTPSGIYFVDNNSKELYSIGGEGLSSVSVQKGMSNWFHSQDINSIKTFYDFNRSDLYIKTKDTVLGFSEKFGQFISFYDYQSADTLFNVSDNFYAFKTSENQMWKLFNNTGNTLIGNPYGYGISFISNLDSAINKVFTNIEFRADWRESLEDLGDGQGINYDRESNIYEFFDKIQVSNEYQDTGEQKLIEERRHQSNLKNRFRTWRIQIPRDKNHRLDRISNPWAKIKLWKNVINNPFIIHDLNVIYYI